MRDRAADPRAHALAEYLRERAAAFSLSADATDEQHVAAAGMALLDAAELAERLPSTDRHLVALTRSGRFEAMPGGTSRFLETPEVRAALQRPLSGAEQSGVQILDLLVSTACGGDGY